MAIDCYQLESPRKKAAWAVNPSGATVHGCDVYWQNMSGSSYHERVQYHLHVESGVGPNQHPIDGPIDGIC